MMMYVFWCVEYVATVTELVLSTVFCGTFIDTTTTDKFLSRRITGATTLSIVMLIVNNINLFSPVTVLIAFNIGVLLNIFVFRENTFKLLVLSITSLLIIVILDSIVTGMISFFLKTPTAEIYQEFSIYRLLAIISSKTLLMLIIVTINKLFSKRRTLQRRYLYALFSATSVMFFVTVLITFMEIKKNVNSIISILFFFVMLILLMIIFFGTFKLTEYYENQETLKLTILKNQMLEKSMNETEQTFMLWKKSMHDYKHNILNLQALAYNKDFDAIIKYLESEDKLLNQQLFYYKTGNDTVDTIINIKQKNAESKNIPFIINASITEKCPVTSAHFASIFGNLLDNAIEASEKVKHPYIEVKIKTIDEYLIISVSNRYNCQNQLLDTTKPNRIFHGIGLNSVRHTVKLYNGEISLKQQDDIFCVNIMIPLSSNPTYL